MHLGPIIIHGLKNYDFLDPVGQALFFKTNKQINTVKNSGNQTSKSVLKLSYSKWFCIQILVCHQI